MGEICRTGCHIRIRLCNFFLQRSNFVPNGIIFPLVLIAHFLDGSLFLLRFLPFHLNCLFSENRRFLFSCRLAVGIAALILLNSAVAKESKNPSHRFIQEISVMRNRNHRPVEMLQIFLQNHQRFNIQIVRRFIQKEDIRRAHQHAAKVQPFPTRKHRNRASLHGRRKKKAVEHLGCGDMSVRRADNFRLITNVINHTLLLVHIHVFLREYTDFHRFAYLHLTAVRLQPSGHNVQQC